MARKVVITGIGTINSLGNDVASTWDAMKSGKLGISKLDSEITEATGVHVGGVMSDYVATDYFNRKQARRLDVATQYAIIAAKEAAEQANLSAIEDRESIGVNVTSGIGGIQTIEDNILKAADKGFGKVSPMFIPNAIINLVAGNVAIELDCKGLCTPVVSACASSTDAIGHAAMYIESGLVDVMVTGGAEAALNRAGLAGFANMGALNDTDDETRASIPFDEERAGFVMGEGAAALVLEDYDHAIARGANILGFVSGYGSTCDANHITAPDSEAVQGVRAVKVALDKAEIEASDVGYINAHGTSTPLNDRGEAGLISKVYGEDAMKPVVTSTKSMTGHLLGATGGLEAIATIMSLNENIATPTIGTKVIEEGLGINVATDTGIELNTEYGMSTSLGFGGHNSVVILKKGE